MTTRSASRHTEEAALDRELLRDVADRAAAYLQQASNRRVVPLDSALDDLRQLDGPLPESPLSPRDVVEWLDRVGSPATVTTTGG
ncbi:MAG: hypothetical protein HYS05_14875, partial [Acidobacteria bacterium]|nr:hypothetical protein [Acidobacteriota bacterium]